jgi:bifunctional enzyme CysN/CysC
MSVAIDDIEDYLDKHQNKQLLRFVAVGSVDDGKSTLIGRLLHDTQGVYEDQLDDARRNAKPGREIDFALITDGLAAEREQGITIDVAYRYFTTARRKFIIADTPGHVQYTRNMATGASTADVCVMLIDARLGVLQQSRRHAYIASLLGIPQLLVCINKMDLVDFDESRYEELKADFQRVVDGLHFTGVTFLPVSALEGDNVVAASERTPWYSGPSLLEHLETVEISHDRSMEAFRLPIQYVIRPNQNYRGFAGQIASGCIAVGDEVTILPLGTTTTVEAIEVAGAAADTAFAPMSVTLRLAEEVDVSRGSMIVRVNESPSVERTFDAHMVWMGERPLDSGKSYVLKHTTRYVRAGLHEVSWKLDMETLEESPASELELNDIGRVTVTAHQPLYFDPYQENRGLGAFVVVDSLTNRTVAAGMIIGPSESHARCSGERTGVSARERAERLGQSAVSICLVGPESDEALLYALERELFDLGYLPYVMVPFDTHGISACHAAGLVTLSVTTDKGLAALRSELPTGAALLVARSDGQAQGDGDVALSGTTAEQVTHLVSVMRARGLLCEL